MGINSSKGVGLGMGTSRKLGLAGVGGAAGVKLRLEADVFDGAKGEAADDSVARIPPMR
jgi:hypothetical protein